MKLSNVRPGKTARFAAALLFLFAASACGQPENEETTSSTRLSRTEGHGGEQSQEAKMRGIAWDSLSDISRKSVEGDWREAEVTSIRASSLKGSIMMESSIENEDLPDKLVQVTFHTNQDSVLGPLVIYIDPSGEQKIGLAPRR